MQRIAVWVCLFLATWCIALRDDGNPLIKPKQLMIGTVVDTTSAEIIRDAVMMMKTMRMFGGAINEATLIVGVTGESGSNLDSTVVATAAALGAQVVLIPQSPAGQAKTLNKFRLFEAFDATAFDYFLWLDADVVFFDDPMPFLHMHHYPGSIECVPDFYNYLQRYPSINTSAEYWNAELPSFHLLGAGETAPHGICNTGMLYFDSQSLSKFNAGLQTILQNATYLTQHAKDRFVDSLIFTEIVNTAGIEVTILPYALNYMALFEIEIQEELQPEEIVLAHMLSDTELYCTVAPRSGEHLTTSATEDTACTCTYRNKLMSPSGSKLRETIRRKILSDPAVCRLLASDSLPTTWPGRSAVPSAPRCETRQVALESDLSTDGDTRERPLDFVLQSPPPRDVTLHIGADLVAQVEVTLHCTADAVHQAKDDTVLPLLELVNSVADARSTETVHHSRVTTSVGPWHSDSTGSRAFEVTYTLQFQAVPPTRGPDFTAQYSLSIADGAQRILVTANLTLVFDHRIPPGLVHYSSNPLLTPKPMALESQLFLPEYLNDRGVRGTGVTVCCRTYKGLAIVERLIQHWQGDRLLVIIDDIPRLPGLSDARNSEQHSSDSQDRLLALQQRLHATCQDSNLARVRKLDCLIISSPPAGALRDRIGDSFVHFIASALHPRSMQFVYSDATLGAAGHCVGAAVLRVWMRALVKNGLMLNSQYNPAQRVGYQFPHRGQEHGLISAVVTNGSIVDVTATPQYSDNPPANAGNDRRSQEQLLQHHRRVVGRHLVHARYAADTLAAELGQSLQLSYAERDPSHCRAFADQHAVRAVQTEGWPRAEEEEVRRSWECSPAWFLHKLRGG